MKYELIYIGQIKKSQLGKGVTNSILVSARNRQKVVTVTLDRRTVSRMIKEKTRRVLGHSLISSFVRSQLTLLHLLHIVTWLTRFAALIRSLAHLLAPKLMGKGFLSIKWTRRFHIVLTHCSPPPPVAAYVRLKLLVTAWGCPVAVLYNLDKKKDGLLNAQ